MRDDFETHPVGTGERLKALEALLAAKPAEAPEPACRATAVFRPRRNSVAVMIGAGEALRSDCITLDAARQLHAGLAEAIRVAGHRADPVGAVETRRD